jgi:hypothetical protein
MAACIVKKVDEDVAVVERKRLDPVCGVERPVVEQVSSKGNGLPGESLLWSSGGK